MTDDRIAALMAAFNDRVLVLDGAMGTMIQACGLSEADYRGSVFADRKGELRGCNDLLCVTRPDVVKGIHRAYLEAGADIVETNSFNSNAISLADYGLEARAGEIARMAARVAREAADEWMSENPGDVRWVAGSVGPTNRSLSMSPDVNDPAARNVTWDEMTAAFEAQVDGLVDGGVDLLLFETCYDTLNLKAALWAAGEVMRKRGVEVPVMVSFTLTEGGRTLSGQTIAAALASIEHVKPITVGLNCSFGAAGMLKYVEELAPLAPCAVCVYPNAGLPNEMGEYDETPRTMVEHVRPMLENGLLNVVGGCCGTTPEHIRALASAVKGAKPRTIRVIELKLRLSGHEHLDVTKENNFVNIGERCNVAGSRKFLRLIKEKSYDEAVSIARTQVENGAQVVDVNMDEAMLDAVQEMPHFLRLIAAEPDVARVPVMIDSSDWDVIVAGLETQQGKCIVNSISLKDGEEKFIAKAEYIKRMGAATVVMAFDEKGQADSYARKIEVCGRAYSILTEKVGFNPQDIIFDPNVLAVATGIEEHNRYAADFIAAVEWIKTNCPGAKVSGGVSNLSFSLRGNNYVREAMHSAFLYHAIAKGMDMAIVNAGAMMPYDDIPKDLRDAIEDVLFDRRPDATDRLIEIAEGLKDKKVSTENAAAVADTSLSTIDRLARMIERGIGDGIETVLEAAHKELGSAIAVIDGPLMGGINRVGQLFGEGKLFLPQVVKSARTMKQAVAWLNPLIEAEKSEGTARNAGKVLIATVKGDVHDIGKNIVVVVLRCNGFEVEDMGVMVPGEDIVARAKEWGADIIALSGLITPSLEEMRKVAALMQQSGMTIPLMVGGATTSEVHTAVKIAPEYDGLCIHTRDAAMMPIVAQQALNDTENFSIKHRARQEEVRAKHNRQKNFYSLDEARSRGLKLDFNPVRPNILGTGACEITISDVRPLINWSAFLIAWRLDGRLADIADVKGCDCCKAEWLARKPVADRAKAAEAMQLYKEANKMLDYLEEVANDSIKAIYGMWAANSIGDDVVIDGRVTIPMMRQQLHNDDGITLSLSDFIAPKESGKTDYIGAFAVTAGEQIEGIARYKKENGDDYQSLLVQTLADRIAEAATEYLHSRIRNDLWGYTNDLAAIENPKNLLRQYYEGIRPAVGYPSMPDQSMIFRIDELLDVKRAGITLTENGAMSPAASTCGLVIAHPESKYFMIGDIGADQVADYEQRKK